jgi:predicted nucleic acid-binding protein
MIIVDTSVLINLFRGAQTRATQTLKLLEANGVPLLIPAICCQEVLQGAKNNREWELLKSYLFSQNDPLPSNGRANL